MDDRCGCLGGDEVGGEGEVVALLDGSGGEHDQAAALAELHEVGVVAKDGGGLNMREEERDTQRQQQQGERSREGRLWVMCW